MKNLITAIGCVMVLMAILMEFVHGQVLWSRIMAADQAVNTFREAVREEGCVSERRQRRLKEELARLLDCREEEVEVRGNVQPVLQGGRISYEIKAPCGNALALAGFWDIEEEKDAFFYEVRQSVTSAFIGEEGGEEP